MSDRDQLAALIRESYRQAQYAGGYSWDYAADAILARWELTPYKACGHPDRYDLRGEDDECIACDIENGDR